MVRIAKQSPVPELGEQLCQKRPSLVLQSPVSQFNIILPDHIRFLYPAIDGHLILEDIDVQVLGENAHGICFLTGVCKREERDEMTQSGTHRPDFAAAFRIDLIEGPILRVMSGERLSVHAWERRIRRRFVMERETDALPLSTMLITAKEDDADRRG